MLDPAPPEFATLPALGLALTPLTAAEPALGVSTPRGSCVGSLLEQASVAARDEKASTLRTDIDFLTPDEKLYRMRKNYLLPDGLRIADCRQGA